MVRLDDESSLCTRNWLTESGKSSLESIYDKKSDAEDLAPHKVLMLHY